MVFDLRIRLVNDDLTPGVVLPTVSIDFTGVDSATSTLKFTVSEKVSGRLDAPQIVAVEVSTGGGWVQPRGGLFMAAQDDADSADLAGVVSFSGENFVTWMMGRTYLHWTSAAVSGERTWANANAGAILTSMLTESKVRGWGALVASDFTALKDSAGVSWQANDQQTIGFRLLTPLTRVLEVLTDQGLCEWWAEGGKLRLFRPGSGADRTNLVLGGPGFSAIPSRSDFGDVFTHLTVVPEKARNWLYLTNTGAPSRFGRLEATMTQSGIEDHATATNLAQPTLLNGRRIKREYSFDWTPDATELYPFLSFNIGDNVTAVTRHGKSTYRVVGLQVSKDREVVTARAIVGDKILSTQAKRDKRAQSAVIGGVVGGSGMGFPGTGGPSQAPPIAPEGLAVTSAVQFAPTGEPSSTIEATFQPVSLGEDGAVVTLAKYELYGRKNVIGEPWRKVTDGPFDSTVITFSPMPVGEDWQFKLRAVSATGLLGVFSLPVSVRLAADTTPPPVPVPPTAQARLGQGILRWSGTPVGGGTMPVDFSHANVYAAISETGSATVVGRMSDDGDTFVVPQQAYGVTLWYYLTAVDTSGNESGPSTRVPITTKPLVDTDIIGRVLDGANIKLESIQADVIAAGALTEEKLAVDVRDKLNDAAADVAAAQAAADAAAAAAAAAQVDADKAVADAAAASAEATAAAADAVAAGQQAATAYSTAVAAALDADTAQFTADGRNRIYRSASEPSGDTRNLLSNASFEATPDNVEVYRNLAVNPNLHPSGGPGAASNSSAIYPATREVTPSGSNPQGILSRVKSQRVAGATGNDSYVMSLYNPDGLLNTGPARNIGAWFYVTAAGYQAVIGTGPAVPLPANAWTWVNGSIGANVHCLVSVGTVNGSAAPSTVISYMTGVTALTNGIPKATIAGGVPYPSIAAPDPDLTPAWMGSENNSESRLIGKVPALSGSTPTSVAFGIQSSKWKRSGQYSLRQIPVWGTRGSAYTEFANHLRAQGMEPGKTYTILGTFYQDAPTSVTGGEARSIQLTGTTTGQNVVLALPDTAGAQDFRMKFTIPTTGSWYLRLYNGGQMGDPDTYWDDIAVVEGEYAGPFIQKYAAGDQWWVLDANNQVTAIKVWDGGSWNDNILRADSIVAANSITAPLIQANAVTTDKLAANAITAVKIAADAITARELAANSVTATQIAAGAVTAGKVAANSITATQIAGLTITAAEIAAGTITGAKLAADTITAREILAATITATQIASNAITSAKIAAGAITAGKIAAGTIVAGDIAANTITGDKLVINAITAREIAALAVSADKLAANAVTADKIAAGAITTVKLAANVITSDKIAGNAIDGMTITGALIRSAASGARSEMTSAGFRTLNSAGQELVKIGYGIPTGMQVRNPTSGALEPLADVAFGQITNAQTNSIGYQILVSETPASSGGPGRWGGWTRHSADTCEVTFTAVASRYIIQFGQAWACSLNGAGGTARVLVAPQINGVRVEATSGPYFASCDMNAGSTVVEARMGHALGGVAVNTVVGATYTVNLLFRANGWGTSAHSASVSNRFITATPAFN